MKSKSFFSVLALAACLALGGCANTESGRSSVSDNSQNTSTDNQSSTPDHSTDDTVRSITLCESWGFDSGFYPLLHAGNASNFGISYWGLPSGERFPTRSMASKPIDWYYGTMRFEANAGLDTLWPKTQKDLGHFFIQADEIHVFCRLDVNPDGDFWKGAGRKPESALHKALPPTVESLRSVSSLSVMTWITGRAFTRILSCSLKRKNVFCAPSLTGFATICWRNLSAWSLWKPMRVSRART